MGDKRLTAIEWRILYNVAMDLAPYCGFNLLEVRVLSFIVQKTLRFKKHECMLRASHFYAGAQGALVMPITNPHRSQLYRARAVLKKSGFIYWQTAPQNTEASKYAVNVLGMLTFWQRKGVKRKLPSFLQALADKVRAEYKELYMIEMNCYFREEVLAHMGSLVDADTKGRQKFDEASAKRLGKQANADLRAGNVVRQMKGFCEEYGVEFYDSLGRKEQKWCDFFVTHTYGDGDDPREILRHVCRLWSTFRYGVLLTDAGFPLTLPENVSFSKFYPHRKIIIGWLRVHADDKDLAPGGGEFYDVREVEDDGDAK